MTIVLIFDFGRMYKVVPFKSDREHLTKNAVGWSLVFIDDLGISRGTVGGSEQHDQHLWLWLTVWLKNRI